MRDKCNRRANGARGVQGNILQNVVEGEEEEEMLVRREAAHPFADERLGEVESVPCRESEKTDLRVCAGK